MKEDNLIKIILIVIGLIGLIGIVSGIIISIWFGSIGFKISTTGLVFYVLFYMLAASYDELEKRSKEKRKRGRT